MKENSSKIPQDTLRDLVDILQRFHVDDLFTVVAGIADALEIPRIVAACFQHRHFFPLVYIAKYKGTLKQPL